ncbi:MAG: hypothetical protein KatS3mg022_2646 [Armatimonadota bacterium]|nr:MAG: hypothetical protein KatS3mg022_2646 [Armatimonadota bacterium]
MLNTIVPGVAPALLYTGTSEVAKVGYSVGFGYGGDGVTGFDSSAYPYGTKRAMQNQIDLILDTSFSVNLSGTILLSDFDSPDESKNSLYPFSNATPLPLEGMGAPGDSGGAVFVQDGSQWYLAGVHSFLADIGSPLGDGIPNAKYGDLLGSMRVSSYVNWINQHIGTPSAIPEPGTMTLVALGLLPVVGRLRGRSN